MNYHEIRTCDMLNGEGLRVVLFVTGCIHRCKGCHNPETWDTAAGTVFNEKAKKKVFNELKKDYIDGLTLTGGDPLHKANLLDVMELIEEVRRRYPKKTIWLYTGYCWEEIFPEVCLNCFIVENVLRKSIVKSCDVVVTGRYEEDKKNVNYPFAGSTNQGIIKVSDTKIW